jgi:hypothetical protein
MFMLCSKWREYKKIQEKMHKKAKISAKPGQGHSVRHLTLRKRANPSLYGYL